MYKFNNLDLCPTFFGLPIPAQGSFLLPPLLLLRRLVVGFLLAFDNVAIGIVYFIARFFFIARSFFSSAIVYSYFIMRNPPMIPIASARQAWDARLLEFAATILGFDPMINKPRAVRELLALRRTTTNAQLRGQIDMAVTLLRRLIANGRRR